tara:strand:+ start:91 stop:234 length:144 start_codon:yes stop_codon:yes gene_type:complete
MLALPELCNWEMGEGERVSPPINRNEKKWKVFAGSSNCGILEALGNY